jgi:uncharacterized protein YbjT (DUF2867 family)
MATQDNQVANKRAKIILVTGATGNQGGAAARQLLSAGWRVRALTRNPAGPAARALAAAGAEVVEGDMDFRKSLEAAANGVYGVFSVQQGALGDQRASYENEVRQGKNVANAAAVARAAHLVYASVSTRHYPFGVAAFESKRAVEGYIERIGIPATVLRPASFMDNYADPAFGVHTGKLATGFAPDVAEQMIAVEDIGRFVALAFADPRRYLEATVAIAGDELTPPQTAQALSQAVGRDIPYLQIPVEMIRQQSADLADAVDFLSRNGGYGADIAAARARHPELMTFQEWLSKHGRARLAALLATAA